MMREGNFSWKARHYSAEPHAHQPWRCLWRGSAQMIRTIPLRRMTLHFRHMRLTDAVTFIATSDCSIR